MPKIAQWARYLAALIASFFELSGHVAVSTYAFLREFLIYVTLFIGSAILMVISAGLIYKLAETDILSPGPFLFAVAFTLVSYLCLGALVFREKRASQRVLTTFTFVFLLYPIIFGMSLHGNQCPAPLKNESEYVIMSYSIFVGNGPSILELSGACKIVTLVVSISGYLGLALVFAVLSSIFPKTEK